jgi:prepilin-type N-terminal cleavage/methylation domain-containing protein
MAQAQSGSRRGFTLIEVLVVVAIIALLVAILLPSLARARKQARRAVCASNLHQVAIGLMTYRQSFKAFPHQARVGVRNCDPNEPGGNVIGAWPSSVHRALARYVGKTSSVRPNEVFYCPSVSENDRGTDFDREEPACSGGLNNPEAYLHVTYMYYGRLDAGDNDPATPRPTDTDVNGDSVVDKRDVPLSRRMYVLDEPDVRRILMTDSVSRWTGNKQWRINHGPDYRVSASVTEVPPPMLEGQNQVFGDGHAKWKAGHQFPADLRQGVNLWKTAQLRQGDDYHWW